MNTDWFQPEGISKRIENTSRFYRIKRKTLERCIESFSRVNKLGLTQEEIEELAKHLLKE